jgi:hypothetical protein
MGLIVTKEEDVELYYESCALNQSKLKKLKKGVEEYLKEDSSDKPHFVIGSAVDTLLTGEKYSFNKKYYVSKLQNLPSELEMNMLKDIFNNSEIKNTPLQECDIEKTILKFNWQPSWKMETKINKLIDTGSGYYDELIASQGKTVLSVEQDTLIRNIVDSFQHSIFGKRFLDSLPGHIDVYFQLPIYFKIKDVNCKALLDVLIIDNEKKTIEIIDLKTMEGSIINFPENAKKYDYFFQIAFYNLAVQNLFKDLLDKGFTIVSNKFLVQSKSHIKLPVTFVVEESVINDYIYGTEDKFYQGKLVKKGLPSFEKLVDIFNYHNEGNGFYMDKIIEDFDGVLTLDGNYNIVNGTEDKSTIQE